MKRRAVFLPMRNCPHRCIYCDQGAITGEYQPPSPWEVKNMLAELSEPVELCYFGGSFTCQPLTLQEEYLKALETAPVGSYVRFSTHPLCISEERLQWLKQFPVSMIELGISSLDDHILSLCNRGYSEKEALHALHLIQENGFCAAAQMMVGLPEQTLESSLSDIQKLAELKGPCEMTLRFYPCLVLRNTALEQLLIMQRYEPLSVEEAAHWVGSLLYNARKLGFAVQRVGLQETETLEESVVAGPHHPAFGELAKSIALALALIENAPQGPWTVFKKDISLFSGHGNWGLSVLSSMTGLTPKATKDRLFIWDNLH